MIEIYIRIKEHSKDEVIVDANFDIDNNPDGTELELEAANLLVEKIDEFIKDINIEDALMLSKEICRNIGKG
jgi:hypothetical protein